MESIQLFLRNILATDTVNLNAQADTLLSLIAIAWGIHLINWAFARGGLNFIFGVRPREMAGVLGIFFAHFFHGVRKNINHEIIDDRHIISNTAAFAPLAVLIALQGTELFTIVSIAVVLSSGLGTWLFGRERTCHVGASGVIYGYLGFLLVYGMASGQLLAFCTAIFVFFVYGAAIPGILPIYQTIRLLIPTFIIAPIIFFYRIISIQVIRTSWEMHLFGFLGGAFMGLFLSDIKNS
jgi:hypothetical protein